MDFSLKQPVLFFVFLGLITISEGKTWALLTAGSSTWDNYRHQADICHAYQILHRNGIPDENIVVMMYDDIANNQFNPTPQIIINKPNGPDVYKGVPKDYTGKDVTPVNFVNVLTGNKEAMSGIGSGKVIDSGPEDDVFVYFADHGAPGLIAFPDIAPPLTKKKLLQALRLMHTKQKYKKMVIYIEACESGSMFANGGLADNIKIFATTAANPRESSYAYYYDEKRETYLGDLYSIAWMEDSDKSNLTTESLQQQFIRVKKRTNLSHVQEYGDESISKDPVDDYQGEGEGSWVPAKDTTEIVGGEAVPAPEVALNILKRRLNKVMSWSPKTAEELFNKNQQIAKLQQKIQEIIKLRQVVRETVQTIAEKVTGNVNEKTWVLENKSGKVTKLECHSEAVYAFWEKCYKFGKVEEALRHVYVLANLCELNTIPLETILSAIETTCSNQQDSNVI